MENVFLEIINAYGMELLRAIVLTIAGAVGLIACRLFTRYADTETKRAVAKTAVLFVEQVFNDLHGKDKMAKAMEFAAAQLKRYGIKFDRAEMEALAEAALAVLNDAFMQHAVIAEGINVDDLTDDQLREVVKQAGFAYADNMTRAEMEAALDEAAVWANT